VWNATKFALGQLNDESAATPFVPVRSRYASLPIVHCDVSD
jgi:hypothetical protein